MCKYKAEYEKTLLPTHSLNSTMCMYNVHVHVHVHVHEHEHVHVHVQCVDVRTHS